MHDGTSVLLCTTLFIVCKFQKLYDLLGGDGEFLPDRGIFHTLAMDLCLRQGLPQFVCENVLFLLCGYDFQQMNEVSCWCLYFDRKNCRGFLSCSSTST